MSMGSLKTLAEDHHCHDILLESPILTERGQWHANPKSNPDLGSESDVTAASNKNQSPQSTLGLGKTMATDQLTFPSESSKESGGGSTSPSPSLSSPEEVDLARSELSHGAESCQLDPVPGCLKETVSGTDNMSASHVSVNNGARTDQPGDEGEGDNESDITRGQCDQRGEGGWGEKSCPGIRRDVSQEITILVTSHDTCVGDEQEEEEEEEEEKEGEEGKEENERAGELERASSLKNIRVEEMRTSSQDAMAPAGRGGPVEGCIVVASLTSTSEVERPQIVGSNCLETGTDRACNAQCKDTEVTDGNQESSDPISNSSSGCLLETQSEAKQFTEANSPLAGGTDLSSQGTAKPIPTESEPAAGPGNITSNRNAGQLPTTNKSCASDSKERLQKAKTLDLSSGRFSASPGKTATVQGQSSLEVVVCHSVATSPMTPPEGSAAFLFPYSLTKAGGGIDNIEEKKEFKSVATAPMSPQNLTAPEALPDVRTAGVEKRSVATAPMSPQNLTAPEALPDVRTAGVEMRSVATAPMSPQNLTAPEAIPDTRTAGVEMRSVATAPMSPQNLIAPEHIPDAYTAGPEMRSVATAPMTPQNLTAPVALPNVQTAGVEMRSVATAPMSPQNLTAPEAIPDTRTAGVEMRSVATAPMSPQNLIAPEHIPDAYTAGPEMRSVATAPMTPQNLTAPVALPNVQTAGVEMRSVATAPMSPQNLTAPEAIPDTRTAGVEMRSVATAPMSPQNLTAPESIPDRRKIGSVQTQKSLEVMCHSVATSPMTPPGGSAAFLFPQPKEIKLRSVATAPMSPQGLMAPEAIPETCLADQEEPTSPEIIPEPRGIEPCDAPPEPTEPVQDVSWDEKGMTWDVYGAVVEVTVLGTAIQKHLEKQVQKQRKQTSSDTDSPAKSQAPDQTMTQCQSPSEAQSSVEGVSAAAAVTGPASAGSQKRRHPKEEKNVGAKRKGRRKNLLRGRFRRLQWPSCCSRSRPEEAS